MAQNCPPFSVLSGDLPANYWSTVRRVSQIVDVSSIRAEQSETLPLPPSTTECSKLSLLEDLLKNDEKSMALQGLLTTMSSEGTDLDNNLPANFRKLKRLSEKDLTAHNIKAAAASNCLDECLTSLMMDTNCDVQPEDEKLPEAQSTEENGLHFKGIKTPCEEDALDFRAEKDPHQGSYWSQLVDVNFNPRRPSALSPIDEEDLPVNFKKLRLQVPINQTIEDPLLTTQDLLGSHPFVPTDVMETALPPSSETNPKKNHHSDTLRSPGTEDPLRRSSQARLETSVDLSSNSTHTCVHQTTLQNKQHQSDLILCPSTSERRPPVRPVTARRTNRSVNHKEGGAGPRRRHCPLPGTPSMSSASSTAVTTAVVVVPRPHNKQPSTGTSGAMKSSNESRTGIRARVEANDKQQSPWLTSPISNATLADQPPASLPPMAAYDRRLGSPVMPRKPKRALQRATAANNSNLQICFMPEAALDSDEDQDMASENGETAGMDRRLPSPMQFKSLPASRRYSSTKSAGPVVESTSSTGNSRKASVDDSTQEDFWRKQARLQAEARIALAQATHMAKMQMEVERQRKKNSPISDMILLPPSCNGHRRLSRTLLSRISNTELNSIHTSLIMEVKKLNEELMTNLLLRDELHMEQDSMLVDLEDLTRYLSAKEDILRVRGPQYQVPLNNNNNNNPSTKQTGVTASLRNSRFSSLKSLVKF